MNEESNLKPWQARLQDIESGLRNESAGSSFFLLQRSQSKLNREPLDVRLIVELDQSDSRRGLMLSFVHGGTSKKLRLSAQDLALVNSLALRSWLTRILFLTPNPNPPGNRNEVQELSWSEVFVPVLWVPAFLEDMFKESLVGVRWSREEEAQRVDQRTLPMAELELTLVENKDKSSFRIEGKLVFNPGEAVNGAAKSVDDLILVEGEQTSLWAGGLVQLGPRFLVLKEPRHWLWVQSLTALGGLEISKEDLQEFLLRFFEQKVAPKMHLPQLPDWREVQESPTPEIYFSWRLGESAHFVGKDDHTKIYFRLRFKYGDLTCDAFDGQKVLSRVADQVLIPRSSSEEEEFIKKLSSLPFVGSSTVRDEEFFTVPKLNFEELTQGLMDWNWSIMVQGRKFTQFKEMKFKVSNQLDWFNLQGQVQFGEQAVSLPLLLLNLERDRGFVSLSDGSVGVLPESWQQKLKLLKKFVKDSPEGMKFTRSQMLLLSDLFEGSRLESEIDFRRLRESITLFKQLEKVHPGSGFNAELREYQKQGLSWLDKLGEAKIGGILADDMGLGKTVQVLAYLNLVYTRKLSSLPTLIVLPKTLLFNWKNEVLKFTPGLRVFIFQGAEKEKLDFNNFDLILVTYASLRIHYEKFRDQRFFYFVADEAQAIKNSDSLSHKTCQLIRSERRLALTGTPVENSVQDLFSLLDFVSPGLLGPSFRSRAAGGVQSEEGLSAETASQLSRSLRPFILRRTKQQVLKDLPDRMELSLDCELSPEERKLYDELREYYRQILTNPDSTKEFNKNKIVVLEALLRLRQAACHPGLLDPKFKKTNSTKVDVLQEKLGEILKEGHRALVFSQFTSFLDLVEIDLKRKNIQYFRLDGKTSQSDREKMVNDFQNQNSAQVFLMSLKAGGVGLNLTAADYVFIMDPWWNPAAEAQAIDRTHRLGQTKNVIAYRLISRGTVEDKIIELQKRKKVLADALLNTEEGLLKKLTLSDLEFLLS